MPELTLPCPFEEHVSLSSLCYYAIGGRARWLALPRSVTELGLALSWCIDRSLPVMVTGKGSNMLFSNEDFPGVVISMSEMRRMFRMSSTDFFCEAGVENSEVALALLGAGRGGGEWLYRLPGMIGATVRMNGRCYGREVSEVTKGMVTVTMDGRVCWHDAASVFRGYKETSLMTSGEVVAGVVLSFPEEKPVAAIRELMEEYERDRNAKHQFDYPSCGSTFKNSYAAGRPSGRIFESLGFKGRRMGGAMVSEHHANFIFNTGGAVAEDVLRLAAMMRQEAREREGVVLDLEVQCAGLFDAALLDACGVKSVPDSLRPGFAWAGLLPAATAGDAGVPRMLLHGPVVDYSRSDLNFQQGITVEVEQLASIADARLEPNRPFIRWTTQSVSASLFPRLPEGANGRFTDRLWEFSVSELFVGSGDGDGRYLEFEMTPEGDWVALRFDAPRQRSAGCRVPSEEPWHGMVTRRIDGERFGMELSFQLVEPFIRDGFLALQCCVSLGEERFGLFPWWDEPGTPDFHQPSRFFQARLM